MVINDDGNYAPYMLTGGGDAMGALDRARKPSQVLGRINPFESTAPRPLRLGADPVRGRLYANNQTTP